MLEWIQSTDWMILQLIHTSMHSAFLDFLMPKITMLGNAGIIWFLAGMAMLISKKYRKYGIAMFIAQGTAILLCDLAMKNIFARPRPCWIENVQLLINMPKDYSFPSGHTLAAVIGAVIITCANHKFGWFAIPLAVLISFSRLYLFVHFPSDVLASLFLGIIIGLATVHLIRKIPQNKLLPA
ncbi:MAG: phosphatase PAP2 family protein [Lactimicrobium sp.]|jgi:undecaprenyl-diphosphatase|uniref:phosphatase PAP2 family protein n=1 Tax=Lactimicrobium sp. TaxID=2563780 RepID=UPI002F350E92